MRTLILFLILSFSATSSVQAFELKAGVAKVTITNSTSRVTVNGPVSEGVHRDIHARALVLNDGEKRLAIVTYDLNCLDVATPFLRVRVRNELGIDPSRLILLATHNHNAPIQINPGNFDYGHWLADRLFDLINEACEREEGPAKVEYGFGDGYFIASRGNAPTDYEIQMLKVTVEDQPLAVFFNHGTHPMQASLKKIGAGHPGVAMNLIEERIPGVLAMYADASGGNQFPSVPADFNKTMFEERNEPDESVDAILEDYTQKFGKELADAALGIYDGDFVDVTGPIESQLEILSLPLAEPISREEADKLAGEVPMDIGFVDYPHPDRGTNWVRMLSRYYKEGLPFPERTTDMVCSDDTYLVHKDDTKFLEKYDDTIHDEIPCIYEEVIVARIGPMPFVAMQGEVCAPIGMRIKDTFRRKMPIFVTAYMGEHNLYIPTRELVRLNAYQAQVIQIQYACPVGWAPEVEDEMVEGVVKLVRKVMEVEEDVAAGP